MNKFKVISATEFLSVSDIRADALTAKAELVERNARLAEQQRQIDDYQKTRSRMSPRNVLQDELAMLEEMTADSAETLAKVEAAFKIIQRGER